MIHVETLRRLLGIADVARDPYAVGAAASDLLAANAADAVAATHYLRALMALGLNQAARGMMQPELQETIAKLPSGGNGAGGGHVPWNSRARRFRANVAALAKRNAAAAECITEAATRLDGYALHQSSDGNYHLQDLKAASVWTSWVRGLANHAAIEGSWAFDRAKTPAPPPIAFDGAGLGWLLLRVLAATEQSYLSYSCAVYLLESDPIALAILLHIHDLQAILAGTRLRVFVGSDAGEVIADFHKKLVENATWNVPQEVITQPLTARQPMAVEREVSELLSQRAATRDHLLRQIDLHYAGRDHAWWRKRFAEATSGGAPLKVLGITTRYSTVLQHSVREMAEAAAASGHEMQIAIEADEQSKEVPFIEMIAAGKPDLIFMVSRLRYENPRLPLRVPFLCWDQDNLPSMRTETATASIDRLTYVAGHGAFHGYVYLGWLRRNCIMCHPAAATHRYGPRELSGEERERYGCDLSYVSNASGSAGELREQLAQYWRASAEAEGLFRSLTDAVLAGAEGGENWNSSRLHGLLTELAAKRGLEVSARVADELVMAGVTVADRAFRHAVLAWAADLADERDYKLRLYGTGWNEHPRFAKYAAGPARQGDELRAIYLASKINLQIIETGFLHSRALDGLAAGGFFLTRRTDYDGMDAAKVRARHELSLHIRAKGVRSVEELEKSSDAKVREWWEIVKTEQLEQAGGGVFRAEEMLRGLEVFAETPAACIVFPQFEQISFTDQKTFAGRAERFLGDDALRGTVAAEMRQVVVEQFSYDARWKQFLGGVVAGMGE